MKKTIALILVGALALGLAGGCTAAQRPDNNAQERTTPTPDMPNTGVVPPGPDIGNMPTDGAESKKISDSLAAEAAKVAGVNGATVVLSGPMAYVGLDVKANLSSERITHIKTEVANRLKAKEKRLNTVLVATDLDTVSRLRRMAEGINQGTPVSTFAAELAQIGARLTPQAPTQ